jgi:hypothetical protein
MVRTTPPKEDKVGTSLEPDDNLADNDPDLLNIDVVEFEIICWMSS